MLSDVKSFRNIWFFDAWDDVRSQFRRTKIGPFWISLNSIAFTLGVCSVFPNQSSMTFSQYLLYVYTGMWSWQFIAGAFTQGSISLINSSQSLLNMSVSPYIFIVQSILRNIINWLFGSPVYFILLYFNDSMMNFWPLFSILTVVFSGLVISAFLTVISRLTLVHRDLSQVWVNGMQLLFFLTPVIWIADSGSIFRRTLSRYNPIYWLLQLIRDPLRFRCPSMSTGLESFVLLGVGLVVAVSGALSLSRVSKYV